MTTSVGFGPTVARLGALVAQRPHLQPLGDAARHPDVMVLDVGMPRLNGFQACERVKRDASFGRTSSSARSVTSC